LIDPEALNEDEFVKDSLKDAEAEHHATLNLDANT